MPGQTHRAQQGRVRAVDEHLSRQRLTDDHDRDQRDDEREQSERQRLRSNRALGGDGVVALGGEVHSVGIDVLGAGVLIDCGLEGADVGAGAQPHGRPHVAE